jgi:hypothetical protein
MFFWMVAALMGQHLANGAQGQCFAALWLAAF